MNFHRRVDRLPQRTPYVSSSTESNMYDDLLLYRYSINSSPSMTFRLRQLGIFKTYILYTMIGCSSRSSYICTMIHVRWESCTMTLVMYDESIMYGEISHVPWEQNRMEAVINHLWKTQQVWSRRGSLLILASCHWWQNEGRHFQARLLMAVRGNSIVMYDDDMIYKASKNNIVYNEK